jgi:hypothetical protein
MNFVAGIEKSLAEAAPDKSGAAGNQYFLQVVKLVSVALLVRCSKNRK